ncbi:MAG: 5-oxoprolinase subunit PxpA [Paracoccaceae bacterium]|nr:5-oxoprolinase subunit PxpA [Paracoccaceae bacterium]
MTQIDLNADLGESYGPWRMGNDDAMLDIVTSANVACGFHAGDPAEMVRITRLCQEKGVSIGAHPGFDDLHGFGRRRITGNSAGELAAMIIYQIGALQALAAAEGASLRHVKMHGALSNMCMTDGWMAGVFARAVRQLSQDLVIMAVAETEIQRAAESVGGPYVCEVFADRAYNDDATLVSRHEPGAVIHDPEIAADNVLRMVDQQAITSVNGVRIPVRVETVCVHGDNPDAVRLAEAVRNRLEKAGVVVRAF